MTDLRPCPACRRHVAIAERACPFCAAALPEASPARVVRGRMSRAAIFAGATLASATLATACGGKGKPVNETPPPAADASVATTQPQQGVADAGVAAPGDAAAKPDAAPEVHIMPKPYGAPPARRRVV